MTGRAGLVRRHGPELALLAAILRDHRSMPGALCRGQAPRFDQDQLEGETAAEHAERLADARLVCGRCPVRAAAGPQSGESRPGAVFVGRRSGASGGLTLKE